MILERKRAEQIYDQARLQAIDPGLLEAGERDNKDPRTTSLFTAKIVPIPAYGTKRLELEYHQRLTASDFKQFFALALKPDAGERQSVHTFSMHFVLHSATAIEAFATPSKLFPLTLATNDPHTAEGTFDRLQPLARRRLQRHLAPLTASRRQARSHHSPRPQNPAPIRRRTSRLQALHLTRTRLLRSPTPHRRPHPRKPAHIPPRTILLLFDNSLSMQWEKLERSYAALEATLRSLKPADKFNVLLFNQDVTAFQAGTHRRHTRKRPASPRLRPRLQTPRRHRPPQSPHRRARAIYPARNLPRPLHRRRQRPRRNRPPRQDRRPNTPPSGANPAPTPHRGLRRRRRRQPPASATNSPKTAAFSSPSSRPNPSTSTSKPSSPSSRAIPSPRSPSLQPATTQTNLIYPLDDAVYPGSIAQWVGQYTPSSKPLTLTAHATREGATLTASASTPLPAANPAHPQLPRLWAQARVNALLDQIDREGETVAAIDEIIRLSRRYKFVTPYTSFLAVPRSLLRPRVIRPGDPVLRVRTDAQITSVIALFPFGLTKPLRHLASEDLVAPGDEANRLWETRFLAPPDMKDGTYAVRLILRDTHGNTYREAKTFVIASTPPTVKIQLPRTSLHRGETLEIHAGASASTRTLTAHLEGIAPITLRWNPRAQTNTGTLTIPADTPIGRYTLTVTAEDIAHNLGTQEVPIDVIP